MENTKKCGGCQLQKNFNQFNNSKRGKFGLHGYCKECCRKNKTKWNKKNQDWIKEYNTKNKNRKNEWFTNKYNNDPIFREKELEQNRIRRRKEPALAKQRENEKFRRATNINYKLGKIIRCRIGIAIKAIKKQLNIDINKCAKSIELLGCSIHELKIYLESKFLPGMTWENHGYGNDCWHIDHIIPCAGFDLTKESEQHKCFHYSNLQPLWQKDNLSKNDKLPNGLRASLI
jgi:hypothetical protein